MDIATAEAEGAPGTAEFELSLQAPQRAALCDHVVQGVPILPGAAALDLALRAARVRAGQARVVLRDVRFELALPVERERELRLRVRLEDGLAGFVVQSPEDAGAGAVHARGRLDVAASGALDLPPLRAGALDEQLGPACSGAAFYAALRDNGNAYGPLFQGVERVWSLGDEAVGALRAGPTVLADDFDGDVAALDAALHVLVARATTQGRRPPFVLAQIDEVELAPGVRPAWSRVRLTPTPPEQAPAGDVHLFDAQGGPVGRLRGVRLAYLSAAPEVPRETLAVCATFTSEPLGEALEFWARALGFSLRVAHAPYNQVFQQLLDPASLLRANRAGAALVLVRLEDWAPAETALDGGAAPPTGLDARRLPNGLQVAHLNAYETDYLYREIFVDRVYARHGVELAQGDCVFDVGANIGLFSLWARSEARDVSVFAFEPSPRLAPLLAANARLAGGVRVFHCGVAERDGSAPFTFYARSSVFSGYHADAREDEAALRAVFDNLLARAGLLDAREREAAVAHFLEGRLEAETVDCPLRTLSSVIDEHGVERIDLLKIDAEKSERAVLAGLRDEHWPLVRQLVLEVHDRSGAEPRRIGELLRARGFEVQFETEELLGGSGLHTLYARRASAPRARGPADEAALAPRLRRLDEAGASLLAALDTAAAGLRVPLLLALCPASPEAARWPALAQRLAAWEERLAQAARALPGVDVLVPEQVAALYPVADAHDRQALELGHIPYTPGYFAALGSAVMRRLAARRGTPPKVVAVDADGTLWNGVVGELGPLGVEVDAGRAALQQALLEQVRAGRLLCVCSKNREQDVRETFRSHAGMLLREEHVSAWRVNWQPKSSNLRALAAELRLGLDSFVLLDDNPLECAEVAAGAPDVVALRLPEEAAEAARFVRHLWLLDVAAVTDEDAQRARLYADDARRESVRRAAPDLARFLAELDVRCEVAPLQPADVERVAQLSERTNQFNLAKRPRAAAEVRALAQSGQLEWLTVRVADRFGDYGLVGVLAFAAQGAALRVDTFLLSCRALGRGVEQRMLAELGRRAEARGLEGIELPFVAAERNQPARDFLEALVPHERREATFIVDARAAQTQTARSVPAVEADAPPQPSPASPQSAPPRDARWEPELATRIATQLSAVEQIVAALAAERRALRSGAGHGSLQGLGPLREAVGAEWSDVLGLPGLGAHDDFFDLGGNSLLLVQAASRVGRVFDRRIPFEQAFKLRTVEALAGWLEEQGASAPRPAAEARKPETARAAVSAPAEGPVSHAQQALFYLHQLAPESWAYNIPFGAHSEAALDPGALRRAFERLLARHALLHTTYLARKGRILAVPAATAPADFAVVDASAWSETALAARLRDDVQRAFDLRRGPLARLRLYTLAQRGAVLLFVTHHIGVDLWSMEIVVDDLLRFYAQERAGDAPLTEAPPQATYADFVRWQQELLDGPEGQRLWAYWQAQLGGELPALRLQGARPPGGARRFSGATHAFALDAELTGALRGLARREGATLFQVLLSGYAALLLRHTAQDDVIIGAPFGGRDVARFGDVVGDFVNLLPLRIDLSGAPGFRELLRRVGACVLGALEHQDFPLPLMVQRLRLRAEPGRLPLVQTTFALHEPNRLPELGPFFLPGRREARLTAHGLELRPVGLTQQEGQFDVALELVPHAGGLWGAFKHDAELLDATLGERFARRFEALLRAAAADPEASVTSLPLHGPTEPTDAD